jgi:hypothetical protein
MEENRNPHRYGLIIIVVVAAITLTLSGCFSPPYATDDTEKITLTLANPFVEPRNTGTAMLHDVTLDIMKKTPRDIPVKWSDVRVVVKGADGSVLLPVTPVLEDTGIYGGTVEVWYSDEAGDRLEADAGDAILITGMEATDYEGAWVEIMRKGERVGSVVLPTDFP